MLGAAAAAAATAAAASSPHPPCRPTADRASLGAMATCTRMLNALADCQKKHPREPYICQHLQRAAAWCLFRQACPDEGGTL